MAEYLVLARKYRPRTFDELVGQEPIAQTLVSAIESERIAHAYLFTGTRGVGKTTLARILAKALNCLTASAPTTAPCNKCDACEAIFRGDDIDVIEIDGASNRGIDEIRQLRSNAIFKPARSRYKVYYIDEVHQITRDAFNALLKTLEEPPAHVKFIFATTEPEKIPPTILSRCQRFDFRNIPTRVIADYLTSICKKEKVKAEADALFRIARAAAGSLRDALSLLDQLLSAAEKVSDAEVIRILGTPPDERTVALVRGIAAGDAPGALGELSGLLEAGISLSSVVAALGDAFRNMMIASTCGADSELIELPESQKQTIGELSGKFSTPALVHAVAICQNVSRSVRGSSVARALVEAALVRLVEQDKFVDPDSLIERLEALAGGEKKKTSLIDAASSRSAAPGQTQRVAAHKRGSTESKQKPADVPIQWDASWLRSNWDSVIARLFEMRCPHIGGLLRPAEAVSFEDGLLKLGFDSGHEGLRRRCAGPLNKEIENTLSELSARPIRCEYVSVNGASTAATVHSPRSLTLSTEEKRQVHNDPGVQEVLSLFGGEVIDVR
ncbi:MAG: DNA polymerase III subunit gamma/tau, partial [Planctomycetota bacterium]